MALNNVSAKITKKITTLYLTKQNINDKLRQISNSKL